MTEQYSADQVPSVLQQNAMNSEMMMSVDTETALIEPTSHRYETNGGGRTTWIVPPKGVADMANAALVFELVSDEADGAVAWNFYAGGLACVQKATLRCGGQILSQVSEAGLVWLQMAEITDAITIVTTFVVVFLVCWRLLR